MANVMWRGREEVDLIERIKVWRAGADRDSALLVTETSPQQLADMIEALGPDEVETYLGSEGTVSVRLRSKAATEFAVLEANEHRELLLILQAALIDVAERDADRASKLAARAYVNLKTDPKGQRRYDGLLHRFTGVLHRQSHKGSD
ncbi:MAG: hypothetical protein M0Z36_01625 [Thermaerobacter sp.]|nr:hypothetical protein [Thermaerobacter sp.]